jgi:hypothetical protein
MLSAHHGTSWSDVDHRRETQSAGAKDDFVRMEDVGLRGNMHEMFLDKNSQDVIKFIDGWIVNNVK